MARKDVPREINRPITIFWFEVDEVLIILASYVGMIFLGGRLLWWIIIGLVALVFYIRIKRQKSVGFLKHLLYFSFGLELKHYPSGLIRKFRE
jgi:type IV conjugative transfer system protein TraL